MIMSGAMFRIVAPIVATVFVFGVGYWKGHGDGEAKGVKLAYNAASVAAQEIVVKEVQVGKCQAEVSKVNEATTEQARKTVEMVETDQQLRRQAEQRAVRRDADTRKRLDAAFSTLGELKGLIDAGAFKGCADERIGDDIVGMLNAALAAEDGGNP